MTTRPLHFNFAYSVSKEHPYVTEGFSQAEAFDALRKAGATEPIKMFNMGDEGMLYRDKETGNTYWITLQE
jgi:hypothetical protein